MADEEVDAFGLTFGQRSAVRATITSLLKIKREQSYVLLVDDIIDTVLLVHLAELRKLRQMQARLVAKRYHRKGITPRPKEYRALESACFGMFIQYVGRERLVADGFWKSERRLTDRDIAKSGAEMYDHFVAP